ncbi:MAG: pentapeptide repeat-containing protein [Alphaproteobacteria bacterium]|nr:pentapeptide repeat-containing protein [Alphaproteobacteria bacterium]
MCPDHRPREEARRGYGFGGKVVTPQKLVDVLKKHDRYVRGLSGGARADLRGQNLSGPRLAGVNLRDASLAMARFNGARLVGAVLVDVDLSSADLRDATREPHPRQARPRTAACTAGARGVGRLRRRPRHSCGARRPGPRRRRVVGRLSFGGQLGTLQPGGRHSFRRQTDPG